MVSVISTGTSGCVVGFVEAVKAFALNTVPEDARVGTCVVDLFGPTPGGIRVSSDVDGVKFTSGFFVVDSVNGRTLENETAVAGLCVSG